MGEGHQCGGTLRMKIKIIVILILLFFLNACAFYDDVHYAPVSDISTIEPVPKSGKHRVLADETLYSIAWRYGLDYRTLAKLNHIPPPYAIKRGQWIYLNKNNPERPLPPPVVKN